MLGVKKVADLIVVVDVEVCRNYGQEQNSFPSVHHSSNKNHHQKEKRKDEKREEIRAGCFRCGGKGHCARDYRTVKHLVELYQDFLKKN